MFGVAATGGKIERRAARRLSTWTRDYLREVALADLGCAVVGVFIAAQVRFGSNVTPMYLGLSLALPVLWIAALWLAGAYDVRFIGTGSDEYRKVLNAGVSLTAAVAIFSYAVNLELSRAYVVIALPSVTAIRPARAVCHAQAAARPAHARQVPAQRGGGRSRAGGRRAGHRTGAGQVPRADRGGCLRGAAGRVRRGGRCPGLRWTGRHHGRGQGVRARIPSR